jgi:CheY-like chemotaxis protein
MEGGKEMTDSERAHNSILIVDDIPDNLAILTRILKE